MAASTGPEHYQQAEVLLARAHNHGYGDGSYSADILAAAQVHATLALAAATAMQAPVDGSEPGMSPQEFRAWHAACGTPITPKDGTS